jgi:hypothetical protein
VTKAATAPVRNDQIVAPSDSDLTPTFNMIMNEWRITKARIEAEMLRLVALLSIESRSPTAHAGVARYEVMASNLALQGALNAVAESV